jgi:hypothetical protein
LGKSLISLISLQIETPVLSENAIRKSLHAALPIKFPVLRLQIPCSFAKIPCSADQGILMQVSEFTNLSASKIAPSGPIRRNSLFFSLLAGNLDAETGSHRTASSASILFLIAPETGGWRALTCHRPGAFLGFIGLSYQQPFRFRIARQAAIHRRRIARAEKLARHG